MPNGTHPTDYLDWLSDSKARVRRLERMLDEAKTALERCVEDLQCWTDTYPKTALRPDTALDNLSTYGVIKQAKAALKKMEG